jgi:uncharacterized membrane protein HdeD (DUF308 family)
MLKNIQDKYRFYGAVLYGIIFIFGLAALIYYHDIFFYNVAKSDFNNWPRFIYVIISSFFGFIFIAVQSAKNHKTDKNPISPILSYFSRYLMILILCDAIIFGVLNAITSTSNYIYYYLSPAFGIAIGYYVDIIATYGFNFIIKIISKI